MSYCKKCGEKLDKDNKFCPNCGTPNPVFEVKAEDKDEGKIEGQNTVKKGSHIYGKINLENLPEGYVIDERYEVKEKLGQGGFGAVYLVYDRELETDKALKVIPEAVVNDKEAMFDLRKEAKTMISLNHPNIVRVYDFHKKGNIKYIDMELVEGRTLTDIKLERKNKQIPEEKVKEYAIKIADGLAYAHSKNVIHKDIKPQNVMITNNNEVKLMDFGIAETVRTSMSRIQNTSSSGTLVYMSPEQLLGENVGKESDIYSFGAMLYELLSGHPPFYKGAVEHQVLNKKPKSLDFLSDNMNKLIMRCLKKDYKDRFRQFEQIIEKIKAKSFQKEKASKSIEKNEISKEQKSTQKKLNKKIRRGMVLVEGGTFQMGSYCCKDERPIHKVKLNSFYIGKYPVTQKEWKKFVGDNPSYFKGDNRPVEKVSWYDAVEFCNKKSEMEGLEKCYSGSGDNIQCDFSANGYRLPTEAEWEYAARGGNKSNGYKYSGSNDIDKVAWYDDNSGNKTHPVGQKKSNELGIYDMRGNVYGWCWDWYDSDYYENSLSNNPTGPSSGSYRVLRGGSFIINSFYCRAANRYSNIPDNSNYNLGFRFAKSVE